MFFEHISGSGHFSWDMHMSSTTPTKILRKSSWKRGNGTGLSIPGSSLFYHQNHPSAPRLSINRRQISLFPTLTQRHKETVWLQSSPVCTKDGQRSHLVLPAWTPSRDSQHHLGSSYCSYLCPGSSKLSLLTPKHGVSRECAPFESCACVEVDTLSFSLSLHIHRLTSFWSHPCSLAKRRLLPISDTTENFRSRIQRVDCSHRSSGSIWRFWEFEFKS